MSKNKKKATNLIHVVITGDILFLKAINSVLILVVTDPLVIVVLRYF